MNDEEVKEPILHPHTCVCTISENCYDKILNEWPKSENWAYFTISGLFNNSMIYKLIGTIEDHISHVLAQFQNISLIKLEKMPEK